jgi:hypothetical protein
MLDSVNFTAINYFVKHMVYIRHLNVVKGILMTLYMRMLIIFNYQWGITA